MSPKNEQKFVFDGVFIERMKSEKFYRDEDQIFVHTQTESIEDDMIDAVEEIIEENPRQSPSAIIVLVGYF